MTSTAGSAVPSSPSPSADNRRVVVVIPIPNDPDWTIIEHIPDDIPIIVSDDSDGHLAPPPRSNISYYDYAAQRSYVGDQHYPALPHKSAASRNFGHLLAYREGYDVIVALDYDCRVPADWLAGHLQALKTAVEAPALAPVNKDGWVNPVAVPGWYARGYPYELRNSHDAKHGETTATGEVKVHMGLWEHIVDLNGIDRFPPHVAPEHPGLYRRSEPVVAVGNIPICGMNTSFVAEVTPAYFFLPDLWVADGSPGGWQLSRHDDIWGGYILKKLLDKRNDLLSFGEPIVEHTRLTAGERTAKIEHYMHLMAREFFELVDNAVEQVATGGYDQMYAAFVEAFLAQATRCRAPFHYRETFVGLGEAMSRWAACFA
ncbi:MAG: hypothetical protein QOJ19_4858 [Acidimicrobiia bacterium]|jgi:hypothetical protein|nr:hypothetical protein [Acidimicrobiia bacterium]